MFIKNLKLNFVVIFQITAMILVGINMISMISMQLKAANALSQITEKKFVYYMSLDRHLATMDMVSGSEQEYDKQDIIKNERESAELNLSNVMIRSRIFETYAVVNDIPTSYASVFAYNKQLINGLKLPLKSGKWFDRTTQCDGIIDAVANANPLFKTGDIIKITAEDGDGKKFEYKIRIIGVLKNQSYIPNASHVGELLFSLSLVSDASYRSTQTPTIIVNSEDIKGIENIFSNTPKNEFIVFNDNISEEEYEKNITELSNKGLITTADDIRHQDSNWRCSLIKENLPMIVFLAVLSICGLVSISIINTTNYIKTLSIYFLCGCKRRECYMIILSYLGVMFIWIFSITLLLALIFSKINTPIFSYIDINPLSYGWFAAVIGIYFSISLITLFYVFKHSTIKENLGKVQ